MKDCEKCLNSRPIISENGCHAVCCLSQKKAMGGYVDEDLYYYYATETEFGYKTEKVKANNAYIKYADGETHIERYVGEFANEKNNLWGFPICDDRYIIYCPDGTVTNEFIVDLE